MHRFDRPSLIRLVRSVNQAARHRSREDRVSLFVAHQGLHYRRRLMFVGRATNGWDHPWTPFRAFSLATVRRIVARALEWTVPDNKARRYCPMSWIQQRWGKNGMRSLKKSAFLRLARELVIELESLPESQVDVAWQSSLVWSNLYKVAPATRGNPSVRLCDLQLRWCVQVLREEVEHWRPQFLVLATGLDWADDFIRAIARRGSWRRKPRSRYLQAHGVLKTGGRFVVVPHPQGRRMKKVVAAALAGLTM